MQIDLTNKTALVTGGTKGIGLAIVKAFLEANAKVIYTGRAKDGKKLDHPNAVYEAVDFALDDSMTHFLKRLESTSIDILVNNAGINKIDSFGEIKIEDWAKVQKVNVEAPFLICRKLAPKMAEKKFGRIVNIGSIFSEISKEKRGSYSTAKFALIGMSKALALDYASANVLVNVVSPGFIDTELTRTILSEKEISHLTSQVPMKRLGTPDEIANLVLFLSSDANSFMTGQNLLIDGGFTCV